jgi:polysaccharide export outer membrane protein
MRAPIRAAAVCLFVASSFALGSGLAAQAAQGGQAPSSVPPAAPSSPPLPTGYTIGSDDVLSVVFWREKDLSTDVVVRPDGLITLPLLNDVQAAGLTPEQLRARLTVAAGKFVTEPNVTVVVKTINSRKVFITGQVSKAGPFHLGGPTTVLQLIATAGGLQEFAKSDKIVILRTENGKSTAFPFNYDEVVRGKNLQQNIELKPGDTVLVP